MDDLQWIIDINPTLHQIGDKIPIGGKRFAVPYNCKFYGDYSDWKYIVGWEGKYPIINIDTYKGEMCYVVKMDGDNNEAYFPITDIDSEG